MERFFKRDDDERVLFKEFGNEYPWVKEIDYGNERFRIQLDRVTMEGFYDNFFIEAGSNLYPFRLHCYAILYHFYYTGEYCRSEMLDSRILRILDRVICCILKRNGASDEYISNYFHERRIFRFSRDNEYRKKYTDAEIFLQKELKLQSLYNPSSNFLGVPSSEISSSALEIVHASINIISLIASAITIADFYYKKWSEKKKSELRSQIKEQLSKVNPDNKDEDVDRIIENIIDLMK